MTVHAYQIFEVRDRKHIPLLGVMCTATELIETMEEIKKNNPLMRIDFKRVKGVAEHERG